jgi:uncharacterized protein
MKYLWGIILAVVLLGNGELAFAASFECRKASSLSERMICSDEKLSALDSELGGLFQVVLGLPSAPRDVRLSQQKWLASIRDHCESAQCLTEAYQRRLDKLYEISAKHTAPFPQRLEVRKNYPNSAGGYCELAGADPSGADSFFSIDAMRAEDEVNVTLDGVHECGRKVWGTVEGKGKLRGNVAVVVFYGGFRKEDATGAAFLFVSGRKVIWRVFQPVNDESYVPDRESFRLK